MACALSNLSQGISSISLVGVRYHHRPSIIAHWAGTGKRMNLTELEETKKKVEGLRQQQQQ